jgi:hypothetical protein
MAQGRGLVLLLLLCHVRQGCLLLVGKAGRVLEERDDLFRRCAEWQATQPQDRAIL